MQEDILYMKRALELAEFGRGRVSPNPMVGCVITYHHQIIGEGWHKSYGGPHAEVNAINDVVDASLLEKSSLYVTLEPCSHWGKTPPCADLIIKNNIKKVVIANFDSNPLVSGLGINKLRDSGIEVITGVLEREGRELNARFFTFMEKKRPYIILKWAQTADGFIAREDYSSKWISNDLSRKIVHKWRSEESAIMVGTKTASQDNPSLNVRHWTGESPIRVVLDRNLTLSKALNLFDHSQTTLCYNGLMDNIQENTHYIKLDYSMPIIPQIMRDLFERKIQSMIVEGGSMLLNEFIRLDLWDEIRQFTGDKVFGSGIASPEFRGELIFSEHILNDQLSIYKPLNKKSNG